MDETLLLSIRPVFAERIFAGSKTAELRRVRPAVVSGQRVLIYSSSPTMALVGSATVKRVDAASLNGLWRRVRQAAGVTRAEYDAYFDGVEHGVAIWLSRVCAFARPLELEEIRKRWPWFRPPQSYCYIQAEIDAVNAGVRELAPRSGSASRAA